jgi:hypothetical protein
LVAVFDKLIAKKNEFLGVGNPETARAVGMTDPAKVKPMDAATVNTLQNDSWIARLGKWLPANSPTPSVTIVNTINPAPGMNEQALADKVAAATAQKLRTSTAQTGGR